MKTAVFLLLLLVVDLSLVFGRQCRGRRCKENENSPIPVDYPHLCGDNIMKAYKDVCEDLWLKRRRKRDIGAALFVQSQREAQDFLSSRRRRKRSNKTDIIEECCGEMCRKEELQEYC